MCFGRNFSLLNPEFFMYGDTLEIVDSYKYLGVTVVAGKVFSTSFTKPLIKFRSSANTILNVRCRPSEQVQMKLLYSICVPNLTYASEVCNYTPSQIRPITVALNDSIRRIFSYQRWESIRFLRLSFGYPSVTDIFYKRSQRFYTRLSKMRNDTLNYLNIPCPHVQS